MWRHIRHTLWSGTSVPGQLYKQLAKKLMFLDHNSVADKLSAANSRQYGRINAAIFGEFVCRQLVFLWSIKDHKNNAATQWVAAPPLGATTWPQGGAEIAKRRHIRPPLRPDTAVSRPLGVHNRRVMAASGGHVPPALPRFPPRPVATPCGSGSYNCSYAAVLTAATSLWPLTGRVGQWAARS